jgi:hypothetical protein
MLSFITSPRGGTGTSLGGGRFRRSDTASPVANNKSEPPLLNRPLDLLRTGLFRPYISIFFPARIQNPRQNFGKGCFFRHLRVQYENCGRRA